MIASNNQNFICQSITTFISLINNQSFFYNLQFLDFDSLHSAVRSFTFIELFITDMLVTMSYKCSLHVLVLQLLIIAGKKLFWFLKSCETSLKSFSEFEMSFCIIKKVETLSFKSLTLGNEMKTSKLLNCTTKLPLIHLSICINNQKYS